MRILTAFLSAGRVGVVGRVGWIGWIGWIGLIGWVGLFGPGTGTAQAEFQRVEAVGIYGIRDSMRSRVIPRDEAISRALWEGVSRVALELIGESAPTGVGVDGDADVDSGETLVPPLEAGRGASDRVRGSGDARLDRAGSTQDQVEILESALGRDTLPYTRSYRILEDQGELPVLFADAPGIETEYVVVVEVIVDVDRVNAALERAGLVATTEVAVMDEPVTIELVGLARYEALQAVLDALRDELGATRVQTLEFERERQVLSVEGPFDAEALLDRVARYRNPRLILEPLGVDPVSGRFRLMGRWYPEPSPAETSRGSGSPGSAVK